MGLKEFIEKWKSKKEKFKEFAEEQKMIERFQEKKKSSNERELERFLKEEREENIKRELEEFRARRKELGGSNKILGVKNMFSGGGNEILSCPKMFGTPIQRTKSNIFFRS